MPSYDVGYKKPPQHSQFKAERVRMIFSRYLALGSVNRLVLDLRERNVRTTGPALIPLLHIYRLQTECASGSDSF